MYPIKKSLLSREKQVLKAFRHSKVVSMFASPMTATPRVTGKALGATLQRLRGVLAGLVVTIACASGTTAAAADLSDTTVFGLSQSNSIIRFISSDPASIERELAITGLKNGEQALAIDQRPCPCDTFLLTNLGNIYLVNTETGVAKIFQEGVLPATTQPSNIEFGPPGTSLNIIASIDGSNFITQIFDDARRGASTPTVRPRPSYSPQDPAGGLPAAITNIAFGPNYTSAPGARLYGVDLANARVVTIDINTGVVTVVRNLGLSIAEVNGFDIVTKVDSTTQSSKNFAFLVVKLQGSAAQSLYSLDLSTGELKFLGQYGGSSALRDIALGLAGDFVLGFDQIVVPESFGVVNVPIRRTRLGRPNTLGTEVIVRVSTPLTPAPSPGEDFKLEGDRFTRRITFAPGELEKTLPIEISNDSTGEPNETLVVQIEMPTDTSANGASVGQPSQAKIIIVDDDPGATGGFSSNVASLSLKRNRVSLRKLLQQKRMGFGVGANCTESCLVKVDVAGSGYALGRIRNKRRDKQVVFGSGLDKKGVSSFAGGRTIQVRIGNRYRTALSKLRRLPATLRITAIDATGKSFVDVLPITFR